MAEQEKKVRVSPLGTAIYPHISRANTKFNPEGVYSVDLAVDPAAEGVTEFLSELHKEVRSKYPNGLLPYKRQAEDNKETGLILVKFKSSYPPKIYDKFGQTIDPENIIIGSGSVIQVSFISNLYEVASKTGMNLYLQAVLVKELVEYKGGTAEDYGFKVETPAEPSLEDLSEGSELNEEEAPF